MERETSLPRLRRSSK